MLHVFTSFIVLYTDWQLEMDAVFMSIALPGWSVPLAMSVWLKNWDEGYWTWQHSIYSMDMFVAKTIFFIIHPTPLGMYSKLNQLGYMSIWAFGACGV